MEHPTESDSDTSRPRSKKSRGRAGDHSMDDDGKLPAQPRATDDDAQLTRHAQYNHQQQIMANQFESLSEQWRQTAQNPHLQLQQVHEQLKLLEEKPWWRATCFALLFGEDEVSVNQYITGYQPPSSIVMFYCDTILRNDFFPYENKESKQKHPPGHESADNSLPSLPQLLPMEVAFKNPPPNKNFGPKYEMRAALRAHQIMWVIKQVFKSALERAGVRRNSLLSISKHVAWNLGGYRDPSRVPGADTLKLEGEGKEPEVPCCSLRDLNKRFLLAWQQFAKDHLNNPAGKRTRITATHALAWKRNIVSSGSKGSGSALLETGETSEASRSTIWFDKNDKAVFQNIHPLPHDCYMEGLGVEFVEGVDPKSDKSCHTSRYVEKLAELMEGNFVDVWAGVTNMDEPNNRLPKEGEIEIEHFRILRPPGVSTNAEGVILPPILGDIVVLRNCFSPLFHARSVFELSNADWIPSRSRDGVVGSSVKERDYRIAIPDPSSGTGLFKLSNDEIPLKNATSNTVAEHMTFVIVARLFQVMDDMIRDSQLVGDKSNCHFIRWKQERSMIQTVVNTLKGVYGLHDDGSFHHCHVVDMPEDPFGVEDDYTKENPQVMCIPHKELMRVASLVLALGDTCYSKPQKTSTLKYFIAGQKKPEAEINLGPRDMHLQLFNVQMYMMHSVSSSSSENIQRLVLSTRASLFPEDNEAFLGPAKLENLTTKTHSHYQQRPMPTFPDEVLDIIRKEHDEQPLSQVLQKSRQVGKESNVPTKDQSDNHGRSNNPEPLQAEDVVPMIEKRSARFSGIVKQEDLARKYSDGVFRNYKLLPETFTCEEFSRGWARKKRLVVIESHHAPPKSSSAKKRRIIRKKEVTKLGKRKDPPSDATEGEGKQEESGMGGETSTTGARMQFEFYCAPEMCPYIDPAGDLANFMEKCRLLPGDVVRELDVREIYHLAQTDHYNWAWRSGEGVHVLTLNLLLLSYLCNNDFKSILLMQEKLNPNASVVHGMSRESAASYISESLTKMYVCGSGGTGETIGSYAEDLVNVNTDTAPAKAKLHHHQSSTLPQNAIMIEAAKRNPILPVFVPWKSQKKGGPLENESLVQFLGLFVVRGMSQTSDSRETVEDLTTYPGLTIDEQNNLGFRLCTHFKWFLEPVEDYDNCYFDTDTFLPMKIPANHTQRYMFSVSAEDGHNDYKGIADNFFKDGGDWEKFGQTLVDGRNDVEGHDEPEDGKTPEAAQDVDLMELCRRKKLSLKIVNVVPALIRSSVCNTLRALRRNVGVDNKVGYLVARQECPLMPSDDQLAPLGVVSRTAPSHMPVREYDPGTAFLLQMVETTYQINNMPVSLCFEEHIENDPERFERLLLTTLVIRFLGNIDTIAAFLQLNGCHEGAQPDHISQRFELALVDRQTVKLLADHVYGVSYRGRGSRGTVEKDFLTDQYLQSLPKYGANAEYCKKVVSHFASISKMLCRKLLEYAARDGDKRFEECVEIMKNEIAKSLRDSSERQSIGFPCLQVMLDLDMIIVGKKWGDHTFAVWHFKGYGGDQGLSVIDVETDGEDLMVDPKLDEGFTESERKIDMLLRKVSGDPLGLCLPRRNMLKTGRHKKTGVLRFLLCYRDYIRHLENDLTNDALAMMGLERHETERTVSVIYNGRPIRACDLEHGPGCTNYSVISRARGTRAANAPNPSRSHCHPSATVGLYSPMMQQVFEKIERVYKEVFASGSDGDTAIQLHIGPTSKAYQIDPFPDHLLKGCIAPSKDRELSYVYILK